MCVWGEVGTKYQKKQERNFFLSALLVIDHLYEIPFKSTKIVRTENPS